MTRKVSLLVNDNAISLDYFVEGFIDHTIGGMVEALEGTGEIKTLDLSIDGDRVTIKLNNDLVPANLFVSKIIKNTVTGMISSLKGVDTVDRVVIEIRR
jgi:hypothetical protein